MLRLLGRSPIRTELHASLRLAIPLIGAQVTQSATGFVDTVMMGWLGQEALALGGLATIVQHSLASSCWNSITVSSGQARALPLLIFSCL